MTAAPGPPRMWLVAPHALPAPDYRPGEQMHDELDGVRSEITEWHGLLDHTVQMYPAGLNVDAEIGIDGGQPSRVDDAEQLALTLLAAVRLARGEGEQ